MASLPDLGHLGELTSDMLTRDVAILQRRKGHRFSSDDVVTAFVAVDTAPQARRVLDLGCGIGSVLLHLAWSMPEATLVGIEAQEISYDLLQHNVARNGFEARVTTILGDLRDPALTTQLGAPFELITGTPPYFPPSAAVDAMDSQRAFARLEYRGGVEAYIATAARHLAPSGTFVMCGDARTQARVEAAATAHQLRLVAQTDVVANAPQPQLFAVWTLRVAATSTASPAADAACVRRTLVLRDANHEPTADAHRLKAFSGFVAPRQAAP